MLVLRLAMFLPRYCLPSLLFALLSLTTALAQPNHNGLAWREPSFSIPRTGKASVAKAALDVLVNGLDLSVGMVTNLGLGLDIVQSATFIQTLSKYDQLTGGTIYESNATAAFAAFHQRFPDFSKYIHASYILTHDSHPVSVATLHSDTSRWGLAAYYASTVYRQDNDTFLNGAMAAWEKVYSFQLSPDIASTGHLASINATFQSSCNGLSVQGAVLWLERGDIGANSETMGPFIALSSYLYNVTHNATYSKAANLTIGFMKNFLSDGKTPTHDSMNLASCTMGIPNNFTYNTGYFIEGIAAYIAMTGDDSQKDFLHSLVKNSLFLTPEWYRSDGVIVEAAFSSDKYARIEGIDPDQQTLLSTQLTSDWKSIYLSGLYTCLRFGLIDGKLADFVRALIAVQYNAIRELAYSTVNGQIVYSPSWNDQPLQSLTAWGQLAAAEVLTLALNVTTDHDTAPDNGQTGIPGSSGSTFQPWSAAPTGMPAHPVGASSSRSPIGAIVGGVVGGLGGLALVALIVLFFLKRRRSPMRKRVVNPFSSSAGDSSQTSSGIEPFLLPGPTVSRTPPTQQVLGTNGRVTKLQAQRYGPTPSEGGWSARPPGSYAPDPAYGDAEDGIGPSGAQTPLDEQRIHTLLTRLTNVLAQVGRLEERRSARASRQPRRAERAMSPAEEKGYGW